AHDTDNLDDARRQLQWVLEKSDQPELALTARLRLARLNLSAGDPDGALTLLESAEPGAFAAAFDEVKGDVHVAKSNIDQARAAYERSLEASDGGALRERIQMKLDDLGHLNFQPEGS
nr:tetratricopeptide repeat protein [Gammaproteobacteria bacterium]